MPLVSIVTPVYNAARWLPETLATVEAQTVQDWEHLLVDDGSVDGSAAILQAAAARNPNFRMLTTGRNQGPSVARNLAIEAARGRYIAFLDADDLWLPEKLEACLEYMRSNGYSFIYHDYRHLTEDGAKIGRVVSGPDELDLRALHTRRGTGSCLAVMIDREGVGDLRFPVRGKALHEDFCLWLRLVKKGYTGRRLARDLARYRLSASSRSANKISSAVETWRIYRNESELSFPRALNWWVQYVWNAFWLNHRARPRTRNRR
jgi:teichuronic acid biosynthesis glycosyltransferase TuaG